jgi:hypothetical protein
MKTGKSLQELAQELDRQAKAKRDFIAPQGDLMMNWDEKENAKHGLKIDGHGTFPLNELGHEQLAGRLKIPQQYYDRMRNTAPGLLTDNVNAWLLRDPKEKRMVRTLDGNVRSFLSDRYRPLDNYDLGEVSFDTLIKAGAEIKSTELTERRLYIKAVTEKISMEIKKGDVVQAGIVISNSEVGCGSVKVETLVYRLVCSNGLISENSIRKYHVGRSGAEGDFASEFFKDETRRADDKAFWMKVRDVIQNSFQRDVFEKIVERMKLTTTNEIEGSVEKAIEITGDKLGFNETERSGVLRHLIKGGDLTQYGLVNAITRTSQDIEDYDRSTYFERLGGVVLELPKKDWQEIANAA